MADGFKKNRKFIFARLAPDIYDGALSIVRFNMLFLKLT